MESNWLQFCATEEQRQRFDDEGYLVVEDALSPEMVEKLTVAVADQDATRIQMRLQGVAYKQRMDGLPRCMTDFHPAFRRFPAGGRYFIRPRGHRPGS